MTHCIGFLLLYCPDVDKATITQPSKCEGHQGNPVNVFYWFRITKHYFSLHPGLQFNK